LALPSWTSNGPDLNPAEILWPIVKARVRRRQLAALKALKTFIEQVSAGRDPKFLNTLVMGLANRLRALVPAEGRSIS
jgi:hypothetical protein